MKRTIISLCLLAMAPAAFAQSQPPAFGNPFEGASSATSSAPAKPAAAPMKQPAPSMAASQPETAKPLAPPKAPQAAASGLSGPKAAAPAPAPTLSAPAAPKPANDVASSPSPAPTASASTPPKQAEPAAQPRASNTSEGVNPFTSRPLRLESRQRDLEISKLDTALLEEQLKRSVLSHDMELLPTKKAAEKTQIESQAKAVARQAAGLPPVGASLPTPASASAMPAAAAATTPKAASRPSSKSAKTKAAPAPQASVPPAAPMIVHPEVVAVMTAGGTPSAVIAVAGQTMLVPSGQMTPMGKLEVLDESSVRLGARTLQVHGWTLSRQVVSDVKPPEEKKPGAVASASSSALMAATPSSAPPRLALPPIPIPPDVR